MRQPVFSVVIPTLNAADEIGCLLDVVLRQEWLPEEILVIDSSSDDGTVEIVRQHPAVRLVTIGRSEFNHGGTREAASKKVRGEFVLFLTQDAIPEGRDYTKKLLMPFEDDRVALVYGRQVPKEGARRFVQLVQQYNYPEQSNVRSIEDVAEYGIKTFFCSDSCSAYRKSALKEIGGIPAPCETNEDMLAAVRLLKTGWSVAYSADARVLHSHNLSLREQYLRNKAVGKFLTEHAQELNVASEVGEGLKLFKTVVRTLVSEKRYPEVIPFALDCAARFLGNRMGRKQ